MVPQIPQYLAREQVPASTGVRGGIIGVPAVQQPGMQDVGPTALERSLQVLPGAVEEAGLLIARTDELRTTAQRALDTTKAYQDWLQQYQAQQATLQQGDYRTLPEETLRTGRQLAVDVAYAHKLDKPSQQLFEARTQ